MKRIITTIFLAVSCVCVMAQSSTVTSDSSTSRSQRIYQVDTLGGTKQVPHDTSFASGSRRTPTDSTRTRLGAGGKASTDAAHTKQSAAKKDTTHVRTSRTVVTKKTHKHTTKKSSK